MLITNPVLRLGDWGIYVTLLLRPLGPCYYDNFDSSLNPSENTPALQSEHNTTLSHLVAGDFRKIRDCHLSLSLWTINSIGLGRFGTDQLPGVQLSDVPPDRERESNSTINSPVED